MPMKPVFMNYVKSYFTFSKGERNGIIFLLIVLAIIIVAIKFIPKKESTPEDFILLQQEVDSLYKNNIAIQINQKVKFPENTIYKEKKPENEFIIELNGSDSLSLIKLPGIGPVYASRIIKYKNLLGGFYHVIQLNEVYGLKEENLIKAIPHISVDASLINTILIDTATFKILARHPYIGKDRAWKIINFRDKSKTGGISSDELENASIFDSIQWQRVNHYFKFQKNTAL